MGFSSQPALFKGIALFTPGGDVVYCIDPEKRDRWHVHLCAVLQDLLGLPEPPHFLVPCYTATLDQWLDPQSQSVHVVAEAYPPVFRYQALLNAIFQSPDTVWQRVSSQGDLCDPVVLITYRHQFATLWDSHDLVVEVGQGGWGTASNWYTSASINAPLASPILNLPLPDPLPPTAAIADDETGNTAEPPSPPLVTQGYVLRLFISSHDAATERILQTLYQILEQALSHPYTLKVIDIFKHPELAEADHISATPTLVKVWPLPVRRIVGNLEDPHQVLRILKSLEQH